MNEEKTNETYVVVRCKSCKRQVVWDQRDRLSYGWFHGDDEGCEYGQYLDALHVERIAVVPSESS